MELPHVSGHDNRFRPPPPPPDDGPNAEDDLPGPPLTPPRRENIRSYGPGSSSLAAHPEEERHDEWALARAQPTTKDDRSNQRALKPKSIDPTQEDLKVEEYDLSVEDDDGDGGVPEPAPPTPFLGVWFEGISPQEIYTEEGYKASTAFQQAALIQLKKWDENVDGRFSANQAVQLVRSMCEMHDISTPAPQKHFWSSLCTCDCLVWMVILALLLWISMVIAAACARELSAEESGVLVTANDGQTTAMASMFVHHHFHDLQTMPEETLRRIHDCTFVHQGASQRLRVASLVRTANGNVRIAAPDRSTLELEGSLSGSTGRMYFNRPFYGKQQVNIHEPADPLWPKGCRFIVMAGAPARARPPR